MVSHRIGTRRHALLRQPNPRTTGKILRSQRIRRAQNIVECSLRHNLAAARTGARAKIDNVIGRADRFLIVFDHDDRIAEFSSRRSVPNKRALSR